MELHSVLNQAIGGLGPGQPIHVFTNIVQECGLQCLLGGHIPHNGFKGGQARQGGGGNTEESPYQPIGNVRVGLSPFLGRPAPQEDGILLSGLLEGSGHVQDILLGVGPPGVVLRHDQHLVQGNDQDFGRVCFWRFFGCTGGRWGL